MSSMPRLRICTKIACGALALALSTTAFSAHADSRSRAAAKSNVIDDGTSESTSASSTSRRAAKERTTDTEAVATRTRTKRSRGPASAEPQDEAGFALASVATGDADVWGATHADQATLDAHILDGNFEGAIGALALFQLLGKALTDAPLVETEQASLQLLLDASSEDRDTTLMNLLTGAEANLLEAAAVSEDEATPVLEAVALQLGFTRPSQALSAQPKLGA